MSIDHYKNLIFNFLNKRSKSQLVQDAIIIFLIIGTALLYPFNSAGPKNCQNFFLHKVLLIMAIVSQLAVVIYYLIKKRWEDAFGAMPLVLLLASGPVVLTVQYDACTYPALHPLKSGAGAQETQPSSIAERRLKTGTH